MQAANVATIAIPASVTSIDTATFAAFPNLRSIEVAQDNPVFTTYNGMLFDKELSSLLLVPEGMEGAAVLPQTVANVPACVFSRCTKLMAIYTDPAGSTECRFASENGILYTSDMKTLIAAPTGIGASVRIAAACTTIAEGAFLGNHALQTIMASDAVTSIVSPQQATDNAPAVLGSFEPDVVQTATVALDAANPEAAKEAWLAAGFANFAEAAHPGDVVAPAEGSGFAFTILEDGTASVRWEGEDAAPEIVRIPTYATAQNIPFAVSAIETGAFAHQDSIKAVEIPSSVKHIGKSAFEGCENLEGISLADGLSAIDSRAFANTTLKSVVLPASVDVVGEAVFDGAQNLTIVARGATNHVSPNALGSAQGVHVYVPYTETGEYGFAVVPTSTNRIMPYGVCLNDAVFDLQAGESANLYDNGGYLYAPGDVKVTCSYKAKSLSVNVETGEVEAKTSGTTNIEIRLTLPIEETVIEKHVNQDAPLEKAVYAPAGMQLIQATSETEDTTSSGTVDLDLGGASKTSTVTGNVSNQYSSDVPVTRMKSGARINHISVTAPLQVTFADADNGGNGLDVSQPLPTDALTTTATFTNTSTDYGVALAGVKVRDNTVSSLFQAKSGAPAIGEQELVKVSNDKDSISWKPSTDEMSITENTPKNFKLKKNTSADWNISLNLAQADLTDAAKAQANGSTNNFATLVWVFKALAGSRPEGTATEDDVNNVFYLKDLETEEIYSLTDVQNHSAALTAGGSDEYDFDSLKEMYENFVKDETLYECVLRTPVSSVPSISLRLIGVLQDKLNVTGAEQYAGLTFQTKTLVNSDTWGGGMAIDIDYASVSETEKYEYFIPAKKDERILQSTYFTNIKDKVRQIVKVYGSFDKNYQGISKSNKRIGGKMFTPSMTELGIFKFGKDTTNFLDGVGFTGNLGSQSYQFYQAKTTEQLYKDLLLQDSSGTARNWWTRTREGSRQSVTQNYNCYVYKIGTQGAPESVNSGTSAYRSYCFCL